MPVRSVICVMVSQSKALVRRSWKLVDRVIEALLPGKVPGSEPIMIQTESLNLWVDRREASRVGDSLIGGKYGTMLLPNSSVLFGERAKRGGTIDVQVKEAFEFFISARSARFPRTPSNHFQL